MEQFNNISSTGRWGDQAALINSNFLKAYTQFVALLNATTKYKGVFSTLSKLQSSVTTPVQGDWAYVGSGGFPMPMYMYDSGSWKANGSGDGGSSVDAVNVAKLAAIQEIVDQAAMYLPIEDDGWHFIDKDGNKVMSVTGAGLDAAKLGNNLIELIKEIDGVGLSIGVTTGTAFDGALGTKLSSDFNKLSQSIRSKTQLLAEVDEDGFFFVDSNGYIGACITPEGSQGMGGGSVGGISYEVVSEININI